MRTSFFAIAHAATSSRERRSWNPIRLIAGSNLTPRAVQPGQLNKDVFKARTEGRDAHHPCVVRMRVRHHAVDDLRRVLGEEPELVAFLACLVYHRERAQLVKPRGRGAVKSDLDRLDALNRLF